MSRRRALAHVTVAVAATGALVAVYAVAQVLVAVQGIDDIEPASAQPPTPERP